MNLWYRIWIYLLPLPMWQAEFFMRTVIGNPEAHDFFPSSLAAAALGMLIPVIVPRRDRPWDEAVRQAGSVVLFLGTFLWLATVYLSIGGNWPPDWIGAHVDQKLWISATLYIIALALNEWKERI